MKNTLFNMADLKYTFRLLIKKPGAALLSIVVLAGGLGISIFAFTVMYTFMYKDIPITNGDSIVKVCASDQCDPFMAFEFSQMRKEISTLDNIGIFYDEQVNISYEETIVDWVDAVQTEWNMFQLSETKAFLGRTLQAFDQGADAEKVAVISYVLWQQLFNGDELAVGAFAQIKGESVKIVGVMPEGYKFPWDMKIWLPMTQRILSPLANGYNPVNAFALLKEGISISEVNVELNNLMSQIRQRYPDDGLNNNYQAADTAHVSAFPISIFGAFVKFTLQFIVSIIAGAIFLLACINVGTLLLARTNERVKDISIRVALGAPRKRLLFQVMGESIVISLMGGVLAVLLAGAGLEILNLFFLMILDQDTIAFWMEFHIDGSTLMGAILFVVLAVLLTSALSTWKIINGDFNRVMRDGTRGALGIKPGRFSRSLVVVSISIITFLLYVGTVFSGELIEFKKSISNENLGEQIDNMVQAHFGLDEDRFSPAQRLQAYRSLRTRLLEELELDELTISIGQGDVSIEIENYTAGTNAYLPYASRHLILGTSEKKPHDEVAGRVVLDGRYINDFDNNPGGPEVAVISSSLAGALWPNSSAVGQRLRLVNQQGNNKQPGYLNGELSPWRLVVGVISDDSRTPTLFAFSANEVFMPLHGNEKNRVLLTVNKTQGGASSTHSVERSMAVLKQAITALDPSITFSIESLRGNIDSAMLALNFIISFVIGCIIFSFLIALAGIYGLVEGSIQMATQEIGTRRALGASDKKIIYTFLLRGGKQVLGGFMSAMLIIDHLTYIIMLTVGAEFIAPMMVRTIVAIIILYLSILLAIYYPIKKVLQMEPSEALRYE